MTQRWTTLFAVVVLVAATAVVSAAQQESIEELRAKTEQGDGETQTTLGLRYTEGRGVPQDDVQAHKWISLSVSRSNGEERDEAIELRDSIVRRLTFDQRAEAQRLAREWDEAHPAPH
tara:strand:- start:180 stop:533 length:354 start_codon:yes stop_codon:yes gene_type:complete